MPSHPVRKRKVLNFVEIDQSKIKKWPANPNSVLVANEVVSGGHIRDDLTAEF